jgi:hypothetical protein
MGICGSPDAITPPAARTRPGMKGVFEGSLRQRRSVPQTVRPSIRSLSEMTACLYIDNLGVIYDRL